VLQINLEQDNNLFFTSLGGMYFKCVRFSYGFSCKCLLVEVITLGSLIGVNCTTYGHFVLKRKCLYLVDFECLEPVSVAGTLR